MIRESKRNSSHRVKACRVDQYLAKRDFLCVTLGPSNNWKEQVSCCQLWSTGCFLSISANSLLNSPYWPSYEGQRVISWISFAVLRKRFISPEIDFRYSSYEVLFLNGSIFPFAPYVISCKMTSCNFLIFVVKILYFLICLIFELSEKQTCAWKV